VWCRAALVALALGWQIIGPVNARQISDPFRDADIGLNSFSGVLYEVRREIDFIII
jgi:hypothetical protein